MTSESLLINSSMMAFPDVTTTEHEIITINDSPSTTIFSSVINTPSPQSLSSNITTQSSISSISASSLSPKTQTIDIVTTNKVILVTRMSTQHVETVQFSEITPSLFNLLPSPLSISSTSTPETSTSTSQYYLKYPSNSLKSTRTVVLTSGQSAISDKLADGENDTGATFDTLSLAQVSPVITVSRVKTGDYLSGMAHNQKIKNASTNFRTFFINFDTKTG